MDKDKHALIAILRSVVCQDGTPLPSDVDWPAVWALARRNHLEAIVYTAAQTFAPPGAAEPMQAVYYGMIRRSAGQSDVLERIEEALRAAGVPYALQKGSILRNDYPAPPLRFMSDLDLCIRPEDRPAIRAAMETIGGTLKGSESGDDQFVFPGSFGVEFHGRLLYRKTDHGMENYPDWSCVDETSNRLTEEGFALNLIGHAVSDLSKGGPGIRYILDLWVYRHRHRPQPDWEAVWARLRADGIDRAAGNLLALSETLFGDGEETELMAEMAAYILAGGLYGDTRRHAAAEVAGAGGKGKTLLRQLFRNRTEFENRYPWLKRYPFLLPAAWLMRIGRSLKRNRRRIRSWQADLKAVNGEEVRTQRETLQRFGL